MLACVGFAMGLSLLTVAFSQNTDPDVTTERRIRQLELDLSNLSMQLQVRTNVSGPQDRTTRDFNLETRLNNLEQRVQQIDNEILNLQRQVFDATRAANQAQSEAQMAQSIARDAANRIR
jgi:uncharacterized protein YlxW (UPF0749 family)